VVHKFGNPIELTLGDFKVKGRIIVERETYPPTPSADEMLDELFFDEVEQTVVLRLRFEPEAAEKN
jgi:hypothetical protein